MKKTLEHLNATLNRLKKTAKCPKEYKEKIAFRWVSKADFLDAIDKNIQLGKYRLYDFFRKNLNLKEHRKIIADL